MEIVIGKNAGFCKGVAYTINSAYKLLEEKNQDIYCLGEIVHNNQVIENLEKMGMKTVKDIEDIPDGSKVIFRSHGEAMNIYERARDKKLQIEDLTCNFVKSIHDKVQKQKRDSFIIVVGKKEHPETVGTIGFAGENSYVIEDENDILDAYIKYEKSMIGKVYVVVQTTFSIKRFDELAIEIEKNFYEADIIIDKTICNTTENRQLEDKKISKECSVMLIIGGENSSNTRKLYEIAKENCENTYYVQTVQNIKNINFRENDRVGIMAGASTPQFIIDEIKNYLKCYVQND